MSKDIYVIKISGKTIEDSKAYAEFIQDFRDLYSSKLAIIVHGGGILIDQELARRKVAVVKHADGRRITDAKTLNAVCHVANKLNKQIIDDLNGVGKRAVRVTAGSEFMGGKYGLVGKPRIEYILLALIRGHLAKMIVPVVPFVTKDHAFSRMLNTNADDIATALALGYNLFADKVNLVFCSDVPGVLRDVNDKSSVIPKITPEIKEQLIQDKVITDGMLLKVEQAMKTAMVLDSVRITDSLRCEGTILTR